jgi:long-chain acyl-CoA synthetase
MQEIINAGEGVKPELPLIKPDDVFVFSYTSGTTSKPKAAMLTHRNFISALGGIDIGADPGFKFTDKDVHLSYLPLAPIYDRLCSAYMLATGGRIGYFGGDVQKIKEDIATLKPTFFTSVPRLYNKIYDGIMDGINKQSSMKKMLINTAISTKTDNLQKKCTYSHGLYDSLVFKKMREAVGGQMRFMITAAAPIAADRLNFLKVAMSCPIVECYGQTEATGASFMTHTQDPSVGHVGGPNPACEFKLVDVPDMKYTSQDRNEKGERNPRGEICLRGPMIFRGYYKDEEKTTEAIDEDGWLHTGDVGMVDTTGRLKIIDRKKNIFKLAHGEYVAPEKIETVLMRSKLVAEIFVYGDSLQTFCVMIIVPNFAELISFCKSKQITEEDHEKLVDDKAVNKLLIAEFERVGKAEGLHGFEIPRKLYLRKDSFGKDGLLTGTLKLKRNEVRDFCREIIQELYKD